MSIMLSEEKVGVLDLKMVSVRRMDGLEKDDLSFRPNVDTPQLFGDERAGGSFAGHLVTCRI